MVRKCCRPVVVRGVYAVGQGSSISGPRAESGPRRPNNWPVEHRQNAEEIYYISFKIHFSALIIYIFLFIINELFILLKIFVVKIHST